MEKKGLCITCVHDKTCIFIRKPPVYQCEEFSDYQKARTGAVKHSQQYGTSCAETETLESSE